MENLIIEKTDCTPSVIFDLNEGVFEIKGKSMPEDTIDFYEPIINWMKEYIEESRGETVLKFELFYFNTASAKMFVELFKTIDALDDVENKFKINWCYDEEDEDIQEAGEDFADISSVPFIFSAMVD